MIRSVLMSGTDAGCSYFDTLTSRPGEFELAMAVTGPDRPCGRGMKVQPSPLSVYCGRNSAEIFCPHDINSMESVKKMEALKADIAFVIDYGKILSADVLGIFTLGCYNIHYSLLPDLRGAGPVRWALIYGYKATGVTLMKMDEKVDTGGIISQAQTAINDEDDYLTLKNRLTCLGQQLVADFMDRIIKGESIGAITQKPSGNVRKAPKISSSLSVISWAGTAAGIHDLVRGLNPYPGARTAVNGKGVKILRTELVQGQPGAPGEIMACSDEGIVVSAADGLLKITDIQPDGKRRMTVKEYMCGSRLMPAMRFS